jgi:hypothetical protein
MTTIGPKATIVALAACVLLAAAWQNSAASPLAVYDMASYQPDGLILGAGVTDKLGQSVATGDFNHDDGMTFSWRGREPTAGQRADGRRWTYIVSASIWEQWTVNLGAGRDHQAAAITPPGTPRPPATSSDSFADTASLLASATAASNKTTPARCTWSSVPPAWVASSTPLPASRTSRSLAPTQPTTYRRRLLWAT